MLIKKALKREGQRRQVNKHVVVRCHHPLTRRRRVVWLATSERTSHEKQKEDLSPPAPKPQSKPRPQPRPQPKPKPQPAVKMKGRAQSADIVARTYFEEIELGGLNTLLEVINLTQDHTVSHIYLKTTLAFKFSRRLNLTNQTL